MNKLTIKKNNFCRVYIETGNASEAYRQSYNAGNMKPNTIKKRASELLADRDVAGTVVKLQLVMQKRHNITVDTLTTDLLEDRKLAHREGQAGAAVAATMSLAKLHGLLVDRKKHSGSIAVLRIERVIIYKGVTMKV